MGGLVYLSYFRLVEVPSIAYSGRLVIWYCFLLDSGSGGLECVCAPSLYMNHKISSVSTCALHSLYIPSNKGSSCTVCYKCCSSCTVCYKCCSSCTMLQVL